VRNLGDEGGHKQSLSPIILSIYRGGSDNSGPTHLNSNRFPNLKSWPLKARREISQKSIYYASRLSDLEITGARDAISENMF
jgi:hypothetical protein